MGKRARKRPTPAPAPPPPRRVGGRPRAQDRPKAPWHPVPLVEGCVLIGVVLIIVGIVTFDDPSGRVFIACGLALGSLAGLDTAVREHFAGFRSHSTLLAGVPAVLVAGVCFFARAPWIALVVGAVAVFAGTFVAARRAFRRRSGGLSFR